MITLRKASDRLHTQIGWLDSYAAIIVPGAVSVFGIFLFMQAMKTVPDELLQAARVDGCSELRLWWEVALPIVRPMIGAFTLLSFMGAGTFYGPAGAQHVRVALTASDERVDSAVARLAG